MPAILRLAFGNLREHKSKTLIMGLLIALGVMIIISGNAFLEASRRGIERDFKAHYSGDVFIHGLSEKGDVSLFGIMQMVSAGDMPAIPALPDTQEVMKIASQIPEVEKATSVIYTMGVLYNDQMPDDWEPPENAAYPYTSLFAVDYSTYFDMLPSVNITEGTFPAKSEPQILLESTMKEKYEKYYGKQLAVGDKVIIQAFGSSMILREVTICGIFEWANTDTVMSALSFIDAGTGRAFAELTYGSVLARELPEEVDTTIVELTEDDLFGGDDMLASDDSFVLSEDFTEESLVGILGDTTLRDKLNETDDGAWHFALLRVKDPSKTQAVIAELNQKFTELEIPIIAEDWAKAAVSYTMSNDMVSGIFTILIAVMAVVVFIVIMNTLIVSIIERTAEIGTMRAIGAGRRFIRGMFFAESLVTTTLAALAGAIIALIASGIVNALNIKVTGETAKVFLGGGTIGMIPTASSVIATILVIVLGSVLANIYPVSVALKITPLKAMNEN